MRVHYTMRFTLRDRIKGHNLETTARANDHELSLLDENTLTGRILSVGDRVQPLGRR